MIQGGHIIVRCNGQVLAAAKTCDISPQCDLIEVAQAAVSADNQCKHYIAGRKHWTISTNHLVLSPILAEQNEDDSYNDFNLDFNNDFLAPDIDKVMEYPAMTEWFLKVGDKVELEVFVDGYPASEYSGMAICTQFSVSVDRRSLLLGRFQFSGSESLSPFKQ